MLIDLFGDSHTIRVLDFLLENRHFDYARADVGREVGLSRGHMRAVWTVLKDLGVIRETGELIGSLKLYQADFDSPIFRVLDHLSLAVADRLSEDVE